MYNYGWLFYVCYFSLSTVVPSEMAVPTQRMSMPPNLFSQPSDAQSAQVLQSGRKKSVNAPPPLSPLQSPPPTMNFNTGTPVEKVLCRPYRHASETEIVDSFNNVELNNAHHERVSMPHIVNEVVPPPKPPRRTSANPRMMEFTNDVVNGSSRSNTASPELVGATEEPPPIPLKKKHRKTLGYVNWYVCMCFTVHVCSEINKMSSLQEISETVSA